MRYDILNILEKLESYNTDSITKMVSSKSRWGRYEYAVELPDYEKAKEMIFSFVKTSEKNGYNTSFIDIAKIWCDGCHEHFIYVRIGAYNYYISEYGLKHIVTMMNEKANTQQLQITASRYGIKNTKMRRSMICCELMPEYMSNFDNDEDSTIEYLRSLSLIELEEIYDKYYNSGSK